MWAALLIIHIMSGSLALLAGPAAMTLPKRHGWHTSLVPATSSWWACCPRALSGSPP